MAQATTKALNGVNTEALAQTIEAVRQQPELGPFQFRADNRWLGGALNRSTIKSFYGAGKEDDTRSKTYEFENDEPPILLGEDRAANPVEYLLHALAGCVTTTTAMHAAARGIEIRSMESHLEGDIDVRGFLGLSNDVPRGYRVIRVTLKVDSDAEPEKLEALAKYSPVYNTIAGKTPIELRVVKV